MREEQWLIHSKDRWARGSAMEEFVAPAAMTIWVRKNPAFVVSLVVPSSSLTKGRTHEHPHRRYERLSL